MSSEVTTVLYASEAEAYIQTLCVFDLKEIGSSRWTQQHEFLEKLNMQAVLCASQQTDEFIKEFFISYGKVKLLIHDLIVTDIWKQKIFSEFLRLRLDTDLLFPVYIVLYHEATVINLLETFLFHRDACEALEDRAVDLIDYCYRKLTPLVGRSMLNDNIGEKPTTDLMSSTADHHVSSLHELELQEKNLNFDICMKTLSILRYFTDHISILPLSAVTRMLNIYDTPILLVQLIQSPPWIMQKNGHTMQYVDTKWCKVTGDDRFKLNKMEGQVWIALFQLLLSDSVQNKYELNSSRKTTLLKLRSYLTEMVLDQMPVLSELLKYLEQMALVEPPPVKRDLILEQMPEIWNELVYKYEGKWEEIAVEQMQTVFNSNNIDVKETARKLSETYNNDLLESLIADPPKCVVCGEVATKRCSRCRNEWYCRRECQVQHWSKHKKACDLFYNSA